MHQVLSKIQKFPNDPIFNRLVQLSSDLGGVRIYDEYGIDARYGDLLNDILHPRDTLRRQLPPDWLDSRGVLRPEAGAIASVSVSGYYYIVSFLTIVALGGKIVPLPPGALPEEAIYYLNICKATYLLVEPNTAHWASEMKSSVKDATGKLLNTILMTRASTEFSPQLRIRIDQDLVFLPTSPCLIIFTSGTTGRPKGAVLPRQRFFPGPLMDHDSLFLGYRPVHWIGGAGVPIYHILQGGRIHFMKRRPSPADFWGRLKEGNITDIALVPAILKDLQDHYLAHIRVLPPKEHDEYIAGVSKLRNFICNGSALNPVTARFWRELTNTPIRNAFGATELGGSVIMAARGAPHLDSCIGRPNAGFTVKLSKGDQGEILVKSPGLFTHYIGDEAATKAAFDEDGFYKTGDLGHLVGANISLMAELIMIIPVLELEEHLMELPYISEAYVLSVLDYESKGLAAALIRLRKVGDNKDPQPLHINLQKLRDDLAATMEMYKLPALLRILQDGEDAIWTASNKVSKKKMLEHYFRISDYRPNDYAVDGVEYWGHQVDMSINRQAWDWEGEA